MNYLISFFKQFGSFVSYPLIALVVSLFLTKICIRVLPLLGYVDEPGGRHIHKHATPRGGGIAIAAAFLCGMTFFLFDYISPDEKFLFLLYVVPAIPIIILGLFDDRLNLKSWLKLIVQIGVALLICFFLRNREYSLFNWHLPFYIVWPCMIVWVIITINAYNLIDGLDGLAAGVSVISSIGFIICFALLGQPSCSLVILAILAAACLGFLRYNFHPAKLFMGDTGSTFLGLMFAISGLLLIPHQVSLRGCLIPLLIIGVPLFDVALAIWRRSMRKVLNPDASGIMDGDKDHLHHRIYRKTHSQRLTALFIYMLEAIFSMAAILLTLFRNSEPGFSYIVLLVAFLIVIRQFAMIELFTSARVIQNSFLKFEKNNYNNLIHPLSDFVMICLSVMIVSFLMFRTVFCFKLFICAMAPVFITMLLSQTYRICWMRSGLSNYFHLGCMILLGSLISVIIMFALWNRIMPGCKISTRNYAVFALLFTLLNMSFILSERFLLHYIENFWFGAVSLQNNTAPLVRVVVYGGGILCRIYVNYLYSSVLPEKNQEGIIGIIDDDKSLRGFALHGFKVLGSTNELEAVYRTHKFDKIVVTVHDVSVASHEKLLAFCKEKNIQLVKLNLVQIPYEKTVQSNV